MMSGIKNPQTMLNQMLKNNPRMSEVNKLIEQYGSPEQAFRHKAQEMGYDPDELINILK